MNGWVTLGVVAGILVLGFVAHRQGWIDLSNKSRSGGSGSGMFGAVDEIFNPSQHNAQAELDRQTILPAPAPLAGDGDRGISEATDAGRFDGHVRIELPGDRPTERD